PAATASAKKPAKRRSEPARTLPGRRQQHAAIAMRLDRFLSNLPRLSRADARLLLAAGRLRVDGATVRDGRHEVRAFNRIELDDELLQAGRPARYLMLHKPAGVVSATEHPEHRTVLDLLTEQDKHELHIAGRLDPNTTGLL